MSIHNDIDHPRIADGTFTEKSQGLPQVQLSHPELPAYDPTFFHDRVGKSSELTQLTSAPARFAAPIRNAIQAVNDSFALENEIAGTPAAGDWVDAKVYKDGDFLVVDVQHKDPTTAPFGSLVVFDNDGKLVSAFDDHTDDFGPRWQPMDGLRGQLLADLSESSNDGSLGDHL